MNKIKIFIYFYAAIIIAFIDRITKSTALFIQNKKITSFFSIDLVFNKGISFGIGNNSNTFILTGIIILITIFLSIYMVKRLRQGYSIFGELLVFVGALSNIFDRFVYGGVIDFILLHYKNYNFPNFNIADVAIFAGFLIMTVNLLYQEKA